LFNYLDASNHQDDRSNVFKSSAFTFYIPIFLLLVCYALYYLYGFFHKSPSVSKDSVTYSKSNHPALNSSKASPSDIQSVHAALHPQSVPVKPAVQSPNVSGAAVPVQSAVVQPLLPVEADYFRKIAEKYELEISGIVEGYKLDKSGAKIFEVMALIDAVDDSHHVKERFTVKELTAMGWSVKRTAYGILVAYDDYSFVVRQKPRDYFGKVPENVTNSPQITGKI
jgi:zona occludens toxin